MFCKKVMVIGAGTMGSGIAQVFAVNGCEVVLNDIKDEFIAGGKAKIDKALTKLVSKEKMTQEEKDAVMGRISGFVTRTADNMKDIDLVVEAAIEDLKIKSAIFKELERTLPGTHDPGQQHVLFVHHADRRSYKTSGQSYRHALLQPGSGHEIDRTHQRHRYF